MTDSLPIGAFFDRERRDYVVPVTPSVVMRNIVRAAYSVAYGTEQEEGNVVCIGPIASVRQVTFASHLPAPPHQRFMPEPPAFAIKVLQAIFDHPSVQIEYSLKQEIQGDDVETKTQWRLNVDVEKAGLEKLKRANTLITMLASIVEEHGIDEHTPGHTLHDAMQKLEEAIRSTKNEPNNQVPGRGI